MRLTLFPMAVALIFASAVFGQGAVPIGAELQVDGGAVSARKLSCSMKCALVCSDRAWLGAAG